MKKRSELERLLSDVLAEEVSASGHDDLLAQTLRLARRKRQQRVFFRGVTGIALLTLLGIWLWPAGELPREGAGASDIRLVSTTPLSRLETVETQPGVTPTLGSSQDVSVVETRTRAPELQTIDDQSLLTLVNRPAALVRLDAEHTQLVFANSSDRDELMKQ